MFVDHTARLNVPLRMLQGGIWSKSRGKHLETFLPDRGYIGPHCIVGEGVHLGEDVVIDAFCSVDSGARIGPRSLLIYRASVGGDAEIGEDSVIGGFICENAQIGARCRVLGQLIHSHEDPTMSWDHHLNPEPSPVIEDDVFVGINATLIGGIRLSSKAYVCAGAILTRDVPSRHIAYGTNKIISVRNWKGKLRESPFFR